MYAHVLRSMVFLCVIQQGGAGLLYGVDSKLNVPIVF